MNDIQRAIETQKSIYEALDRSLISSESAGLVFIPVDRMEDIKTAISSMQELRQKHRWIPVEERLPEDEWRVLITDGYIVTVGRLGRDSKEWYTGLTRWREKYQNSVLAWKPLPEPYQPDKCTGCFGAAGNDCKGCNR